MAMALTSRVLAQFRAVFPSRQQSKASVLLISLFRGQRGFRNADKLGQVENTVSGASDTTGNTVIGTTVMGQYTTLGNDHVSYQASVVPEPGSFTLLAVGMGLAWLIWRVK